MPQDNPHAEEACAVFTLHFNVLNCPLATPVVQKNHAMIATMFPKVLGAIRKHCLGVPLSEDVRETWKSLTVAASDLGCRLLCLTEDCIVSCEDLKTISTVTKCALAEDPNATPAASTLAMLWNITILLKPTTFRNNVGKISDLYPDLVRRTKDWIGLDRVCRERLQWWKEVLRMWLWRCLIADFFPITDVDKTLDFVHAEYEEQQKLINL